MREISPHTRVKIKPIQVSKKSPLDTSHEPALPPEALWGSRSISSSPQLQISALDFKQWTPFVSDEAGLQCDQSNVMILPLCVVTAGGDHAGLSP